MWGADDPCDRMPMVWPEMAFAPQQADPRGRPRAAETVAYDRSLAEFYRAAIALRRQHPALRHGSLEFLEPDDAAGFLGFRRSLDGEALLVGFNRGAAPHAWSIPLAAGQTAREIFTASGEAGKVQVRSEPGRAVVTLPGREAVVIRLIKGGSGQPAGKE